MTAPIDLSNKVLASKYRVGERIGEGGMGIVFAGEHVELKTSVAIKVLQPKLAEDAAARARFLREARLAARIQGEHSARIFDVGTDEDAGPFLVMELLHGEPVDVRLAREVVSPSVAVTIMLQLLDALAEAHAKGLVHRDLKPGNLFLVTKPGESVWVKVLDFGISKVTGPEDRTPSLKITEPHALLGSPEYMSPEQLRDSTEVDARSDLWACGVLLFELLTGEMPFEGSSLPDLCANIVSSPPRSFADAGATHLSASLERVVERCLRKEPAERPSNAYELALALAPFGTEASRVLLPRIRAWCKSEATLPDLPRARRVTIGGVLLVGVAGVVAFAAASLSAPQRRVTGGSATPVEALTPLAPAISTAAASSIERDGGAPGPIASAPPTAAPTSTVAGPSPSANRPDVRPKIPPTEKKRVQTPDAIDLIQ